MLITLIIFTNRLEVTSWEGYTFSTIFSDLSSVEPNELYNKYKEMASTRINCRSSTQVRYCALIATLPELPHETSTEVITITNVVIMSELLTLMIVHFPCSH